MNVYFLDPEKDYLDAIISHLEKIFPNVVFWPIHAAELNTIDNPSDPNFLLIYTENFYPELQLEGNCIRLYEHLPYEEIEETPSKKLLRLGPIKYLSEEIKIYLEKSDIYNASLMPLQSYFYFDFNASFDKYIKKLIIENQNLGFQTIILELGLNAYFPASETDSNFLLHLQLKNINKDNFGNYLEPWPDNKTSLRIIPAKRADDWLLSPTESLRQSLQLLNEWAKENYSHKWKVFVIAKLMPFQHLRVLASMSENIVIFSSDRIRNQESFTKELSELKALLANNATFKSFTNTEI